MTDLILHHYPASPFAEKVRLILGAQQLPWRSVTIPVIMPKPDLTALTGGYRRTPVLQMGADIFCDTALIANVLNDLGSGHDLYPETAPLSRSLSEWADSTLFQVAVAYVFQPAAMEALMAGQTPEQMQAFAADRATMRLTGDRPRLTPAEAEAALRLYLSRFESALHQTTAYLFDAQQPSIADFSVYHPLWFIERVPPIAGIFDDYPSVRDWLARITAIGHGEQTPLQSEEAIAIAHQASTSDDSGDDDWVDCDGLARGTSVTVTPTDYALDPVAGALTLSAPDRIALQRSDERAGRVQVHFPRLGFRVAAQQ